MFMLLQTVWKEPKNGLFSFCQTLIGNKYNSSCRFGAKLCSYSQTISKCENISSEMTGLCIAATRSGQIGHWADHEFRSKFLYSNVKDWYGKIILQVIAAKSAC